MANKIGYANWLVKKFKEGAVNIPGRLYNHLVNGEKPADDKVPMLYGATEQTIVALIEMYAVEDFMRWEKRKDAGYLLAYHIYIDFDEDELNTIALPLVLPSLSLDTPGVRRRAFRGCRASKLKEQ